MTEVKEPTAPASEAAKHDKSCPFCNKDAPRQSQNDLSHNADLLRDKCHDADNLGLAEPSLDATMPGWSIDYTNPVDQKQRATRLRSNPHHCIPARASLKGAYQAPLLEYIENSKGTITADIGYNVNDKGNGIWLPTIPRDFYGGNNNKPIAGIKWGALTAQFPDEQFTIAEAAMYSAGRQFHDAHPAYSEEVKKRLEKLRTQMFAYSMRCPEAKEKPRPNVPPPYGLVDKLEALSVTLSGKLTGPADRWTPPFFTSRHAALFGTKLRKARIRKDLGL